MAPTRALVAQVSRLLGMEPERVAALGSARIAEILALAETDNVRALADKTGVSRYRIAAMTEAERIAFVKDRGRVPESCGPAIPEAPARGAFQTFQPQAMLPDGPEGYVLADAGYRGRDAIRSLDAFDRMLIASAKARKGKGAPPLTDAQIAMGRRYRELFVTYHRGVAPKSCLNIAPPGSGGPGNFMEWRAELERELSRIEARIGDGIAIRFRKLRPSRARSVVITDRRLVHLATIEGDDGMTASEILRHYGWPVKGETRARVTRALADVLDRMQPPVSRARTGAIHYGGPPASPWNGGAV